MPKDDYYVIAYRLLAYMYECLKSGEAPNREYIKYGSDAFPISEIYWSYIMSHLYLDDYIEGILLIPVIGRDEKGIKITPEFNITPKGIEYLQSNSTMQRVRNALKELKEIIPGV